MEMKAMFSQIIMRKLRVHLAALALLLAFVPFSTFALAPIPDAAVSGYAGGWYQDAAGMGFSPSNNASFVTASGTTFASGVTGQIVVQNTDSLLRIGSVNSTTYAAAVTNADYVYSTFSVTSANWAPDGYRVIGYRYKPNGFSWSSQTAGARLQVAIYDASGNKLADIGGPQTTRGPSAYTLVSGNSPVLLPNTNYQIRFYVYSTDGGSVVEIDDMELLLAARQTLVMQKSWVAPLAGSTATLTPTGTTPTTAFVSSTTTTASKTDSSLSTGVIYDYDPLAVLNVTETVSDPNYLQAKDCVMLSTSGTSSAVTAPYTAKANIVGTPTTDRRMTCTFTNTMRPKIRLSKTSVGGVGQFNFNLTGAITASDSITTTSSGTNVLSTTTQVVPGAIGASAVSITETAVAGYDTTYSCTDTNAAVSGNPAGPFNVGSGTGLALQIPAANLKAGANIVCTFVNTKRATLRIGKKRDGTQGGPVSFGFTGTGPTAQNFSFSMSTSERFIKDYGTATVPYAANGVGSVPTTPLNNLVAGTYTIVEFFTDGNNNDFELTSISCTDLTDPTAGPGTPGSGISSQVYGVNGGTGVINLVAGANYYCEFVNTQKPLLVVTKQVQGQGGVPFNFSITATGTGTLPAPFTLTPPTNDNVQANLTVNLNSGPRDVTITEALPPSNYVLVSASCTKISKQPNGTVTNMTYPGDVATRSATITGFSTTDTANCQFINAIRPTVTIKKVTQGDVGTFSFTGGTNGIGPTFSLQTTTPGTAVASTTYVLNTSNAAASITETIPTGWRLADINCTSAGASVAVTKDLTTGALTIPAALTTGGAVIECTFTNFKRPTIKVSKTLAGSAGTFNFSYSGAVTATGGATDSLSPATNGTANSSVVFYGTSNTPVTITEAAPAGSTYDTSWVCTDSTSSTNYTGTGTVATIQATGMLPGSNWTCAFTNSQRPTIQVSKVSYGDVGTFTFSGDNGFGTDAITTSTAGTQISGQIKTLSVAGAATRISEVSLPAGFNLTGITCTGLAPGGAATPNIAGRYVDLNPAATAAGAAIKCIFSNSKLPSVEFTKAKISNDSTAVTASFSPTASSNLATVPDSITSGTADNVAGSPNTALIVNAAGVDVRVTETPMAGFVLTKAECEDTAFGGTFNAMIDSATGLITIPGARFVTGAAISCKLTNTKQGTITIIKDTVPDSADVFDFTTTGTGLAAFTLDDDGNTTNTYSNTKQFTNIAPGTYTIAETANAAYTLSSLTCTGDITGGTNTASTTAGNTATIKLDPGEAITCTFTNTKKPTLTVAKVSNGGTGGFAFTGTNGYPGETITTTVIGQETLGTKVSLTTAGAVTTITETAPPAEWALSGATCTGIGTGTATFDAPTRTVTLNAAATAAGNDIKCVFTNTKAATLKIAKISKGTTGTFNFTASGGATPANVAVTTTASGTVATTTLTSVPTGTDIVLTELTPSPAPTPNYFLTDITCVNAPGAPTGSTFGARSITNGTTELGHRSVNLVAGADVTCTFTNSVQGILTITKQTIGPTGTFNFSFNNAPAGTTPSTPSVTTSAATGTGQVSVSVPHDASITYDLIEAANTDYQLRAIACDSGNPAAPATFVNDVANRKVTITSQPGAVKDCRFVNVHKPNVTIKKQTVGGTGSFTLSGGTNGLEAANAVVLNTATTNPATSPATYKITDVTQPASITESIPAGENWTTTWECVNTASVVNASGTGTTLTLDAAKMAANGLDITCTFTNTKSPKLTVVKQVVGGANVAFNINVAGGGLASAQNVPLTPTTDGGTAQQVVTGLAPSTNITLSEAQSGFPSGWTLSSMVCVNNTGGATGSSLVGATETINTAGQGGSITGQLVPGADVTCTFKNTRNVTGNLIKKTFGGDSNFTYDVYLNVATPGTIPDYADVPVTTTNGTGNYSAAFPSSGTGTFVIQEDLKTGWTLTNITCTKDAASGGTYTTTATNVAQRYIAGTVTAGTVINCEFTNVRTPVITLAKKSIGGTGTFTFGSGTNGLPSSANITTTTAGTTVNGTTTYPIADINAVATVTETVPSGWTLTGAECSNATGVVTTTLSGSQLTIPVATLQQGNDLTCVFTNTKDTKLTLAKKTGGGFGAFPIQVDVGGTVTNPTLTTTTDGETVSTVIANVTPNTAISLTELAGTFPADWSFASATCVDNSGGTTGSTLVSATGTANTGRKGGSIAGQLVTGADVTCTFYNTKNVKAKVVKTTVGGDGNFSYNAYLNVSTPTPAALAGNFPLTTTGGTGEVSAAFPQVATGTFVVEETAATGWVLDSISCTQDPGSPGTLTNVSVDVANRYATGTVGPGTQLTCNFKNIRKPIVKITKVSVGGSGAFPFTTTGLLGTTGTVLTTNANSNTATSAGAEVADINGTVTIWEQPQVDWTLASVSCIDSLGTVINTTRSGNTLTIATAELRKGLDINCTFTNKKKAAIRIRKTVRNDNGGVASVLAFQLGTSAGTLNFGSGTISGNDATYAANILMVDAGTYTLTEAAVANYDNGTWTCSVNGGPEVVVGAYNAGSITLADGDDATCSILNDDTNKTNLSITKSDSLIEVVSGTTTTYTLVVNNVGPARADGAVLKDTPTSGLKDCKIVSCSTTGGAGVCPATGTVVPETGYSYTISTLPALSTMTLGVQCSVK